MTENETERAVRHSAAVAGSSVASLRDAAKWIIGAAAAVAALLVAGLEFADLAALTDTPAERFWFAVGVVGAAVGLAVVYRVIVGGAAVLAGQTISLSELIARQIDAEHAAMERGAVPDPATGEIAAAEIAASDPLLYAIYNRREVLFRGASVSLPGDLSELVDDAYRGLRLLEAGDAVTVGGLSYSNDDAGKAALREHLFALERLEQRVVNYVATEQSRTRFDQLLKRIRVGGLVVVAALALVAVAAAQDGDSPTNIIEPTTVEVFRTSSQSGTADACFVGADSRIGVAMPGSWSRPTVMFTATDGCPAQRVVLDPSEYVFIPMSQPSIVQD